MPPSEQRPTEQKKLAGIFISYRRSDNPDATGRIYDRLVAEFGKSRVFKDVDSIPLGQDFRGHLNEVVGNCAAMLAIIGPRWTEARNEAGHRRLEDPDDFVRIELEASLARNVPVVPVLVGHAAMPGVGQLPSSLASLVYRQSIEVRPDPDFHNDAMRLLSALKVIIDPDAPREEAASSANRGIASAARWRWVWPAAFTVAALAALAMTGPTLKHLRETPPPETRVEIVTPTTDNPESFALSPDGRQIVFAAKTDGTSRLWLRSLATTTGEPLTGTEGGFAPFWSPDGRSIAFFADGNLKRLELSGKQVQTLAPASPPASGTWGSGGDILFAQGFANTISRIAATGGEVTSVSQLASGQIIHRRPRFLPDGRRYLFVANFGEQAGIFLGSLDDKPPVRLSPDVGPIAYLPSGWLLRGKAGALLAQQLDVDKASLIGESESLAEGVSEVSVATTGLVAYRGLSADTRQLVWRNRSGAQLGVAGEQDPSYYGPNVSPDGRRVGVSRTVQGALSIWLLDSARGNRVTFTGGTDLYPLWSPDGARIAFTSRGTGPFAIYQKRSNGEGAPELLTKSDQTMVPTSWSADGRYLMYFRIDPSTHTDIEILPMKGDGKPFTFLKTRFEEGWGRFSPDGKWVAYQSRETGRYEVYVRPFIEPDASGTNPTAASGQWLVSTTGGIIPTWTAGGSELVYINPAGEMMAVPIAVSGSALTPGTPVKLFQTRVYGGGSDAEQGRQYDVTLDGRFLINTVVATDSAPPITLIQNWNPDAGK